eukprot:m.102482 g.102482  ORF g.102482 m.102482 type:complete len:351 (+) comp18777_c0_seq3:53-1105(+)
MRVVQRGVAGVRGLATNAAALPRPVSRVLSGIQSSGVPHLGNYLGALRTWVALQRQYDSVLYGVMDLHSLTLPTESAVLRQNTRTTAAVLLAVGVDPHRSIVFQQSLVPEHCELAWIFSCLTQFASLQHMTQWKDRIKSHRSPTLGLFSYPVLMAADILVYRATHVPVGQDQIQHLELASEVCKAFNRHFGDYFAQPKPVLGEAKRVANLRRPEVKMSKSDPSELGRISLLDTADDIQKKIRKAVTDSISDVTFDEEARPGIANLIRLVCALEDCSPQDVVARFQGQQTIDLKDALIQLLTDRLAPIQGEYYRLMADPDFLHRTVVDGSSRAREIASATLQEVKTRIGLC